MDCWRWVGVVFNGAEELNIAGTTGIALVGVAAAIAGIVYGMQKPCIEQNVVIGLACWFLFESIISILAGVMAFRKAKDAFALRNENARLSTELHTRRGRLRSNLPEATSVQDSFMVLAVEAFEAGSRRFPTERVELRRRIRLLESETRRLASALRMATTIMEAQTEKEVGGAAACENQPLRSR
jgi:hypothetical protein